MEVVAAIEDGGFLLEYGRERSGRMKKVGFEAHCAKEARRGGLGWLWCGTRWPRLSSDGGGGDTWSAARSRLRNGKTRGGGGGRAT